MFYFKIVIIVYTISISIFAWSRSGNLLIKKNKKIYTLKMDINSEMGMIYFCYPLVTRSDFLTQTRLRWSDNFVSVPGHSYYNCNTTKTSVALPIRAWFDWCPVPTAVKRGYRDPHGSMAAYFEMLLRFCTVDNSFGTRGMCNWFWENHLYVFLLSSG